MSNSLQRKYGAVLSYVSILVNTIIQLIYLPFLIKMLGQSEYGLYSLVSSIIGYLTILDLGFGNAIVVYATKYITQKKYDEEQKLYGMFRMIFFIIGLFISILGIILYFNVDNIFGSTMTSIEINKAKIMILILTFNLGLTFAFNIYSSIITVYEKFVFQKLLSIISSLLRPMVMIPFLLLGYKSITLCIVLSIINVSVLLLNFFYCRKVLNINIKFNGFDNSLFKVIFSYSIWIFFSIVVDKINWSLDQFILGACSGTVAVSIYSVASQVNTLFINLSTAISGVMLPKMSKIISKNNSSANITNEFIKIGRIQYLIVFFMFSSLVLFGKEFIISWVGIEFKESYYIMLLLVMSMFIPLIQNLGLSIMQAMNKYKFKSITTFIMSIFNIIISIFLVKSYGAIGAAIGTAISLIICNVLLINIYYYKVIKIDIIKFWKEIFNMSLYFIVPIVFLLILMKNFELHGYINLIVFGSIYTIVYSIVCYYFVMNNYEKNLVNVFLKKSYRDI